MAVRVVVRVCVCTPHISTLLHHPHPHQYDNLTIIEALKHERVSMNKQTGASSRKLTLGEIAAIADKTPKTVVPPPR